MTGVEGPRGGRGGGDSGCRRWRRGDRHRGQERKGETGEGLGADWGLLLRMRGKPFRALRHAWHAGGRPRGTGPGLS